MTKSFCYCSTVHNEFIFACSDGAKVFFVRDSTGHHSGSTLRTLLHARRWRVFWLLFLYYFTMRLLLVTSSTVEAPSHPLTVIVFLHGIIMSYLGRAPALFYIRNEVLHSLCADVISSVLSCICSALALSHTTRPLSDVLRLIVELPRSPIDGICRSFRGDQPPTRLLLSFYRNRTCSLHGSGSITWPPWNEFIMHCATVAKGLCHMGQCPIWTMNLSTSLVHPPPWFVLFHCGNHLMLCSDGARVIQR